MNKVVKDKSNTLAAFIDKQLDSAPAAATQGGPRHHQRPPRAGGFGGFISWLKGRGANSSVPGSEPPKKSVEEHIREIRQ